MIDKRTEPEAETKEGKVRDLVEQVSQSARDLVKNHVELAKLEIKEKAARLSREAAMIAAGAICALFALILLSVALAAALGSTLGAYGWGFLIVGAFWLLLAVILGGLGYARLKREKRALPATQAQLRLDRGVLAEV